MLIESEHGECPGATSGQGPPLETVGVPGTSSSQLSVMLLPFLRVYSGVGLPVHFMECVLGGLRCSFLEANPSGSSSVTAAEKGF